MLFNYLKRLCGFNIYERILIFDFQDILCENYLSLIEMDLGYSIFHYEDVEEFRYLYETRIKKNEKRYLIIIKSNIYIPYDIREDFHCLDLNYSLLFPKLNSFVLENSYIFDLDLLHIAHENLYRPMDSETETKGFLSKEMFLEENINEYMEFIEAKIDELLVEDNQVSWRKIALLYGKFEYIKYRFSYKVDKLQLINKIQDRFKEFILKQYSSLSGLPISKGPIQLNRGLDYIFMESKKFALIIMDGMSILDWLIISEGLERVSYKYNSTLAIIPTITSISRQSFLSGKFPVEIERPFSLNHEKSMFFSKCMVNGYKEDEIKYIRGYDFEIDYKDKAMAIIINDIDDLVHSQKQGNQGMFNDIELLSKGGKLLNTIKKLYNNGFDVYIGSDHGHKETKTIGNIWGTGIEVETKSKRVIILKEFADYERIRDEFSLIDYPAYFLPKDFKYLICEHNESFGIKGDKILSHGGISIEEVIVPFIKIEGVR